MVWSPYSQLSTILGKKNNVSLPPIIGSAVQRKRKFAISASKTNDLSPSKIISFVMKLILGYFRSILSCSI